MTSSDEAQRPDQWTREQVRGRLGQSLYLEAGAGTGKTDALVTRISQLLAEGAAQPEQIAAITFTRAAAFEMRFRLRSALEQRVADEPDEEKRARITAVLDGLDSLAIQTIHAFALSMLRETPLEAGLPPVIDPLDDIQAAVEFDDRWSEWFAGRIEDDEKLAPALGVAQRLGLRNPVDLLRETSRQFGELHHLVTAEQFGYDGPAPPSIATSLLRDTLTQVRDLTAAAPEQADTMCRFVNETFAPELESLLALTGDADELPAADFAGLPSFRADRKGAKKNWSKAPGGEAMLDRLREILAGLQDEIDDALDPLRRSTLSAFLVAAADFAIEYARFRRVHGRLTFHDQLVLARDLLQANAEARERFRSRYRFILVDEFQDTDPVQIDLLKLLAGGADGGLRDGSLFIVGDPKQSIYRFRGADPISAGGFAQAVAASGDRLPLSENHRSLPGVLRWVNAVFSGWMLEGEAAGQASYHDLRWDEELEDAAIEAEAGGQPVRWFGAERDAGADATRWLEFEEIASIAAAAGAGSFRVRDRDNEGGWRDSTFADVAVLMRRRTGIDMLEDALVRNDVPYVFDSQSPLFTSQDVRDLHACLAAIDDPADQVAVLAAIRSPAFSCPDTDLLRWKQAGGGFTYLPEQVSDGRPDSITDAFAALRSFHLQSREVDTATLVERFIRERRLREKAMLSRLGPERVRRLDLVVELANALSGTAEGSESITLRDFTRWLARQSEENAQMPDRVSQGVVADAVRVMTVHRAKGLEFPIVIMASASGGGNNSDSVQLRTLRTGQGDERLEVQLGRADLGLKTSGADEAMGREKADSELEDVRLLYVAATRARDHLFVSRYRPKRSSGALVEHIERHLEGNESLWQQWIAPTQSPRRLVEAPGRPETPEAAETWMKERYAIVREASRSRYTTPTALKPGSTKEQPLEKEPSERLGDETGRYGRGATELGRAVHAVLQLVDLGGWSDGELAALARRMADDHGVGGSAVEIAELARTALATDTMARAAAAARRGQAWREVSVAAPLEGEAGELEGQIDLLFREEDGSLTVIDHKTDRIGAKSLAESAAPYLLQMGAYAWCTERVTGMKVSRAVLLFARRVQEEEGGEYAVPELDAVKAQAAQMASERVSAPVDAG